MTPHVALTHPIPHYISHIQDVPRESSVCSRIGSKPSLVDSPNSNVARVVCLVLERFCLHSPLWNFITCALFYKKDIDTAQTKLSVHCPLLIVYFSCFAGLFTYLLELVQSSLSFLVSVVLQL